ncbi:MAG: hypothetical protein PHP34_05530 [Bacteroidales bacterium]|nr:hypothetical protein [Bacteroidales bacterium]
MYLKSCIYFCIIFLASGCVGFKPENIIYNTPKRQYEYVLKSEAVTLRNYNNQLIDSTNIGNFQKELQDLEYKYPFVERLENNILLKNSDFRLAGLYADANKAIQDKNFTLALKNISTMRHLYPDIDLYSDSPFLEGYAYEQLGQTDTATMSYRKFYTFSEKKYSELFRGYRHADINDSMYIAERNHAYHFLNRIPDSLDETVIRPITPRYYFTGRQPGFILNPDNYNKSIKFIGSFSLGLDLFNDLSVGFLISTGIRKSVNFNAGMYLSKNMSGYLFSLPIQLFKSDSNKFGIKLSPFINYRSIDSIKIDDRYCLANEKIFDFGAKISSSFFFSQKFYIGSHYQYNYYNRNHKYFAEKPGVLFWTDNEFDLSGYYNLFKDMSLKVGVKNSDIVAGIYLNGLEISYNITSPGFVLRTDVF